MIKKRTFNFLILEVLISFLLLSFSILPFSSYPYRNFKKELGFLESLEMKPYVNQSFSEIFENISTEKNYKLSNLTIPYGKKDTLNIKRKFSIKYISLKTSKIYKKAIVTLTLKSPHCEEVFQKKRIIKQSKDNHAI
ncbi:MAG: hypothetical protein S4CHLAM20_12710 [Chlamydiia bacterium]|nr:hypothetical protein [Chlamydiia bacterium]